MYILNMLLTHIITRKKVHRTINVYKVHIKTYQKEGQEDLYTIRKVRLLHIK